jgi:hypothetical protein
MRNLLNLHVSYGFKKLFFSTIIEHFLFRANKKRESYHSQVKYCFLTPLSAKLRKNLKKGDVVMSKQSLFFALVSLMSLNAIEGKSTSPKGKACSSHEACINDDSCLCYCSRICEYRAKKEDDRPVWDEEKGMCFCKQWDQDNYQMRKCDKKNPQHRRSSNRR